MVRDQDAQSAVLEGPDDPLDIFDGDGVDPGERFVEENEIRVGDHGPGDLETTPFSAR